MSIYDTGDEQTVALTSDGMEYLQEMLQEYKRNRLSSQSSSLEWTATSLRAAYRRILCPLVSVLGCGILRYIPKSRSKKLLSRENRM
ncbi:MAG TPA: hypothetical protein VMM15_38960 [Bradyrhizobium sp.]|nr:hypothetical protein [Bradyrhizobium sp.]